MSETTIPEQLDNQSSTSFETSTKGFISYKVKVYDKDADVAFAKAVELMDMANTLCKAKNGQV